MIILIHSSKTMKQRPVAETPHQPQLLAKARQLDAYLKTLQPAQLAKVMGISGALAQKTHSAIADWNDTPAEQSLAIDTFVGDIYSGLRGTDLSPADRAYADTVLRILSGLYGILRPLDGISPYRLEMGYKLPSPDYADLYRFWGKDIVQTLPTDGLIVNVSSVEYSKTITPFVDQSRVVTPQFLTVSPDTGEPTFVVVHAKIARGAFARWLITTRITNAADFTQFAEIGYVYDAALSTPQAPAFVAQEFGGKGLSMRLS
ncbi:MAG TPA: YaaA family protein [Candidatus Saccharimonadales bacterium]|nr:YaaA family protein [Candidatus Saccharimonadales bacterium]